MVNSFIRLDECCRIELSSIDKKSKPNEKSVKLCNFTDVYYNWNIYNSMVEGFMEATASDKNIDVFSLKVGDVVVTKDSETRNDIGMSAYIHDNLDNTVLGYHCALIRPFKDIDGAYLNAFLNSSTGRKHFENQASGSGQRYTLTKEALGSIRVPLINIEEQRVIGKLFNDLDRRIINNNKISAELESLAKTIYDYWFLQFEFPNEEGKPYKSSGGKMVYNEELKREIPEGWKVKPLIECVSKDKNAIVDGPFGTQMKISEYVDSGVPIYEMEQLNGLFIVDTPKHFITEEKYEEVKRSTVKNGDIIISKTGTLGLLGVVNSDYEKGIVVSRLAKITPDESVIGKYALLILLKELEATGYWLRVCGGSTMPILNNSIIGNVKVLIPNNDLFQKYESCVTSFFDKIYVSQKENQQLTSLRDWLLPMLMNGQATFKETE